MSMKRHVLEGICIPLEVRHDLCRHVDTRVLEYVVIKGVVSQHDDTIM